MKKVTLKIDGMSCGHCVGSIESAIKEAGAVGKVDLKAGSVAIEFDASNLSLDTIKTAIEQKGYEVLNG